MSEQDQAYTSLKVSVHEGAVIVEMRQAAAALSAIDALEAGRLLVAAASALLQEPDVVPA